MPFGIYARGPICKGAIKWTFGKLAEETKMKFLITIFQDEDGVFIAECPAIPGCVSQGETEIEAEQNIKEAIKACLAVRGEKGMPLTVAIREVEVQV